MKSALVGAPTSCGSSSCRASARTHSGGFPPPAAPRALSQRTRDPTCLRRSRAPTLLRTGQARCRRQGTTTCSIAPSAQGKRLRCHACRHRRVPCIRSGCRPGRARSGFGTGSPTIAAAFSNSPCAHPAPQLEEAAASACRLASTDGRALKPTIQAGTAEGVGKQREGAAADSSPSG
eukprot:scaffold205570_cov27-Tisochrysis_lutea.AAC.2